MNDDSYLRDPARQKIWKKHLLAKGAEVAAGLVQILNGKEVEIGDLPKGPSDKEIRLRQFLEQIDRGIKRVGGAQYGRCAFCGGAIPQISLDERPWTERCPQHPAY